MKKMKRYEAQPSISGKDTHTECTTRRVNAKAQTSSMAEMLPMPMGPERAYFSTCILSLTGRRCIPHSMSDQCWSQYTGRLLQQVPRYPEVHTCRCPASTVFTVSVGAFEACNFCRCSFVLREYRASLSHPPYVKLALNSSAEHHYHAQAP